MPIQTQCPKCNQPLALPDNALGKKARCPSCNDVFSVETPAAAAPSPPASSSDADATGIKNAGTTVPKPAKKPSTPPGPPSETRPATRKLPAKKSGSGMLLAVVGIGLVGCIAITCLGGAAGFWFLRDGNVGGGLVAKKDKAAWDDIVDEPDDKNPAVPKVAVVEIKAPKLEQDKVTRELPGNLDNIVVGGGGRFILLNLPQMRKIAMFDANEAKVVHYFPVSGDNVRYAASMDKLVMVFPDTKIVQRWSLISKERELTSTLDINNIAVVAMGSASNGPLLVGGGDRFGGGGHGFFDLKTLKPMTLQQNNGFGGRSFGEVGGGTRVSADGTVFGCWGSGSPTGLQTYVLVGNQLKSHYEHTTVGHIIPGPDGKYVYTGSGLYTNEVKPVGTNINRDGNGRYTIPAVQGNYYITVSLGERDPFGKNRDRSITVHQAGEERSLITLTDIEIPVTGERWDPDPVGRDKRYILIPDAKMFVTIPQTNNRIVIHRFDVEDALEKAGIDYLFVTSRPPSMAQRKKTYTYQIKVKSKKGGVKYKLDAGPEGMKVGADGKVTWKVGAEGDHNVIITISDKAGQEIFHTFKISVGNPVANAGPPDGKKKEEPFAINDPPIDLFPKDFIDKDLAIKDLLMIDRKEERPKEIPAVRIDLPPLPERLPIVPPKLTEERVTRALPDTIGDVTIGGGGRFIICHLPKARQLAIFDANEAKVVKFLPVAGDNIYMAAGMTKLFVVFPDTKLIQRWSLTTFERELTNTLPLTEKLAGIGMGYGSDGPLFVQTSRGIVSGDQLFFDAKTLKRLDIKRNLQGGHVHIGDNAKVRGSMDGRVLGITAEHDNGHFITLDTASSFTARSMEGRAFIPGADGKHVFGLGVFNQQGQKSTNHNSMWCVPSLQGNFYLGVPNGTYHPQIANDKDKFGNAALYITGDTRPLLTLPDVDKAIRDVFSGVRDPLRIDQRYHFIPDAQILVTIPTTADKLVVHKLDLDAALDKAGIDYLFVNSAATPVAVKGQAYQYQVQVKSKKGIKSYKVDSGPPGMKVSATGVVTWPVPKDFADSTTDVIMSIADKADQEIFHTFKIAILAEAPKVEKAK